ncbi:hypothetical protein PAXINDRAFT_92474, partial [Paxillus involutus ATCC 200175]
IIISFFFKQYVRKKKPKVETGRKRRQGVPCSAPTIAVDEEETAAAAEGEVMSLEDAELSVLVLEDEQGLEDATGQADHDEQVAKRLRDLAVREMEARGILISDTQKKEALGIFPKVAGLAKKVHDSTTVGEQFSRLRIANQHLLSPGNKETLDRRVPTRWNSDLACLDAHLHFRPVVEQLTGAQEMKSFRLTEHQWPLATTLAAVLSLMDEPTKLFSQKDTPLVPGAVPMLSRLETALRNVSNDSGVAEVIRVAAHAGVLLSEKYYTLLEECEVYSISIVMCPDKKLNWFTTNVNCYTAAQVSRIRTLAVKRWQESYRPPAAANASGSPAPTLRTALQTPPVSLLCRHFNITNTYQGGLHSVLLAGFPHPSQSRTRWLMTSTRTLTSRSFPRLRLSQPVDY